MAAIRNAILIVVLAPVITNRADAQIRLGTAVLAAGGGEMSSIAWTAFGTIGQSVIGRSVGTSFAATGGFWGDGATILDVGHAVATGMPDEFALQQNYPNPFNPSTTIRYALPARSHVTLTVYNTLGQQVATLVEGEVEAGYHAVKFDASRLPSGVYLYRLHAGNYFEVRKALLMK